MLSATVCALGLESFDSAQVRAEENKNKLPYRVTHLIDENLPLTQFRQFWQLVGRCYSCLLHAQAGWRNISKLSQREVFININEMRHPVSKCGFRETRTNTQQVVLEHFETCGDGRINLGKQDVKPYSSTNPGIK